MKNYILGALIFTHFSCLFAQKGVFEIGLYAGKNLSHPVNFIENREHWVLKPLSSNQLGLSFGYRFNEFYTMRSGAYFERKGFMDSSFVCGNAWCLPGRDKYLAPYLTIPMLSEFHFLSITLLLKLD